MSVASFCGRLLRAWRAIACRLWPPSAAELQRLQRERQAARLARLQERLLAVRRRLERLASLQREKEERQAHLNAFVACHLESPEAVTCAIELEQIRAILASIEQQRAKGKALYRRLLERFDSSFSRRLAGGSASKTADKPAVK